MREIIRLRLDGSPATDLDEVVRRGHERARAVACDVEPGARGAVADEARTRDLFETISDHAIAVCRVEVGGDELVLAYRGKREQMRRVAELVLCRVLERVGERVGVVRVEVRDRAVADQRVDPARPFRAGQYGRSALRLVHACGSQGHRVIDYHDHPVVRHRVETRSARAVPRPMSERRPRRARHRSSRVQRSVSVVPRPVAMSAPSMWNSTRRLRACSSGVCALGITGRSGP